MKPPSRKAVQLLPTDANEGPATEYARRLAELANAMDTPHAFRKGQFVRWKAGLKNRSMPAYSEVAVVREALAVPVFDGCEEAKCAGTAGFGEPLTLILAVLDPDGAFIEIHIDGRRLEPAELKAHPKPANPKRNRRRVGMLKPP